MLLAPQLWLTRRPPNPMPVITIDAEYVRPQFAAIHLLIEDGRAAFVDTGTNHSVPQMMTALKQNGLTLADVDYVFLTHVHLDHAGGAGTLMTQLPNAKCVIHPRGVRHMVDPTKLVAASKQVYGEVVFQKLYGELTPIPQERIISADDGFVLKLGSAELEFIHTAGHANHHYSIVHHVHKGENIIFAGDTFGMSYRQLDTDQGAFIAPLTTPTQFDPEAAHRSIDRFMSYAPQAIYLTHYSRVENVQKLAKDLHEQLDDFVALAKRFANDTDNLTGISNELFSYLNQRLDRHGVRRDEKFRHSVLGDDVRLNAQGLQAWLKQATA
jgi:glyoxylase-like metal-dependent hydrolase (beta-lactamase superfamily II)